MGNFLINKTELPENVFRLAYSFKIIFMGHHTEKIIIRTNERFINEIFNKQSSNIFLLVEIKFIGHIKVLKKR